MVDLTTLITNLQADVDAADSDTSMRDILALLHRGSKITTFHRWYDSASVLPIDSAYGGYIAFTKSDNALRVFNDSDMRWAALDSALEAAASAPVYSGTEYGYVFNNTPAADTSVFNRYPFASDANATDLGTDVGSPTLGRTRMFGGGGNTKGFHAGGFNNSSPTTPGQALTYIASFPYASGTPLADTSYQLNVKRMYGHNEMIGNRTYIYYAGGQRSTPTPTALQNVIEKTPEVVSANATDVGDLISVQYYGAAHSSDTHGYLSGGFIPGYSNRIEKWTFASDANSTDVGDLTVARAYISGHSSSTDGYTTGGVPTTNGIEKFPFASDGNSADTGQDITAQNYGQAGTTSDTHGYLNGGQGPPGVLNVIEKFPFADDAGATDVGDLAKITAYDQATSQN